MNHGGFDQASLAEILETLRHSREGGIHPGFSGSQAQRIPSHRRSRGRFAESTSRVEASPGTVFGIRTSATGLRHGKTIPVRIRVAHPPIRDPVEGTTHEVDEWDSKAQVGHPRFAGWRFGSEHEPVPGTWTIQVLMDGEMIAEQAFDVSAE